MYSGLKQRKTYDEMLNYLATDQEKIIYPDRTAKLAKEWIDQKFADYNLYKEIRLQDELKQNKIEKLFVSRSTQKSKISNKAIQTNKETKNKKVWVDWNNQYTQTPVEFPKTQDAKVFGPREGDALASPSRGWSPARDHIQIKKLWNIITIEIKS